MCGRTCAKLGNHRYSLCGAPIDTRRLSDRSALTHFQDTVATICLRDTLALCHIFLPRCATRIAPRTIDHHHVTMARLHHHPTGEDR